MSSPWFYSKNALLRNDVGKVIDIYLLVTKSTQIIVIILKGNGYWWKCFWKIVYLKKSVNLNGGLHNDIDSFRNGAKNF